MTILDVFQFDDYQKYLRACLPVRGKERGGSSRLAEYLGCQLGFISLVLKGKAHFSLENAVMVSEFLNHSEPEQDYFLLLVERARAGSKKLELIFEKKIESVLTNRKKISARIVGALRPLSEADQAVYYGDWIYTALHMAVLNPELQTAGALSRFLRIPIKRLSSALAFMFETGLLQRKNGKIVVGATRIHLPADSPLIQRHHLNWRVKALHAVERASSMDLHYTSVISVSKSGAARVHELILRLIREADEVITGAKDEVVYSFVVDYYPLGNRDPTD